MGIFRTIALGTALLFSIHSQAVVLTATPLENAAEAKAIYQPVADLLTEALGLEVTFEYAEDWQHFSKNIIADRYDIILAEPHIAAYATSYNSILSMNVLTRMTGEQTFHTVVAADSGAGSLKSLQTSRICMLPSPNFSGVLLKKEFTNPVSQPITIEVRGGFEKVYEYFKKGRCDAAMINEKLLHKLQAEGESIKSIFKTKTSPNTALTVSQRLPPADRKLLVDALQNTDNNAKLKALHTKYGSMDIPFIPANNDDYVDFNILPGVVWGW